jgi:hypothetical protein
MRSFIAAAAAVAACAAAAAASSPSPPSPHRDLVGPFSLAASTDCAMRNLTLSYALSLLPERAPLASVFDALRLAIDCNMTLPTTPTNPTPSHPLSSYSLPTPFRGGSHLAVLRTTPPPLPLLSPGVWYVDPASGSDANPCSLAEPCATINFALGRSRSAGGGGTIVLRGTGPPHVLGATLTLGPSDSGLTISAFPGENPVVSGGAPLSNLSWSYVGPSPNASLTNATVWRASLPPLAKLPFSALFLAGTRMTRARYPNGNPETDLVPVGYTKAASWLPPPVPVTPLWQLNPLLNTTPRAACPPDACEPGGPSGIGPPWAIFCCFFWGVNASVENFTTGSFWGAHPGPPGGATFHSPGGLVAGQDLLPRLQGWANPTAAVVHAFHGSYWGGWSWPVSAVNATSGEVLFGPGGWQEARGASAGDYLYVENVREELDFPGEWYVEEESESAASATLYFCANGTNPPPADGWVAGQLAELVTLEGNPPAAPVANVTLAGLTFAYSEPTFLEPFTAPSGGDWSFQNSGAVRLSGTANCTVLGSLFINLGANGVAISGWNRGAAVVDSEFVWLGENAVVSAGLSGGVFDNTFASGAGYGEGPVVRRNLVHEVGLFVRQAGFYYQGMTANATVDGNVFFNGPRAGININDGFGGGHKISRNVGFNMVRETSDHGPFNVSRAARRMNRAEGR